MKYSSALSLLAIAPLACLASPLPEVGTAVSDNPSNVFKRSEVKCKIIKGGKVNCRSGPGTKYTVLDWIYEGRTGNFMCWTHGECIDGNCTWDKLDYDYIDCYVSGAYTDSKCSTGNLPKC